MSKNQSGNQTANTPTLSETELRQMHVDELRERAKREGVSEASSLRKDELVRAISQRYQAGNSAKARSGEASKAKTKTPTK